MAVKATSSVTLMMVSDGAKGSDGKVIWVEFTGKPNAGPVGARGQYYNDHLGYVEADVPTDNIK